jgi:hypothetical protein
MYSCICIFLHISDNSRLLLTVSNVAWDFMTAPHVFYCVDTETLRQKQPHLTSPTQYLSNVFPGLNYALRHEDVWKNGGIAPPLSNAALNGDEWSASRLSRFTPAERAPGTHCIRDWVGLRAGVAVTKKRNISSPVGKRTPTVQPVARPLCGLSNI